MDEMEVEEIEEYNTEEPHPPENKSSEYFKTT